MHPLLNLGGYFTARWGYNSSLTYDTFGRSGMDRSLYNEGLGSRAADWAWQY
jgi:hypothetical protein